MLFLDLHYLKHGDKIYVFDYAPSRKSVQRYLEGANAIVSSAEFSSGSRALVNSKLLSSTSSDTMSAIVTIKAGASSPNNGKYFVPESLTVSKGTTVTWKNLDDTMHTVTSGKAEGGESGTIFDSSYLAADKTFEWKFNSAGTFDYYCTLHPYMKGRILVN